MSSTHYHYLQYCGHDQCGLISIVHTKLVFVVMLKLVYGNVMAITNFSTVISTDCKNSKAPHYGNILCDRFDNHREETLIRVNYSKKNVTGTIEK